MEREGEGGVLFLIELIRKSRGADTDGEGQRDNYFENREYTDVEVGGERDRHRS